MKIILAIGVALGVTWLALMTFVWTRGGLGKGRKYGNKIAAHLGMKGNFFHAVLDNGVDGQSLLLLFALEQAGLSVQQASVQLAPSLERGMIALENRFGPQEMISNAKPVVIRLVKEWEQLQLER